jgi:hypothetical protein
MAFPETSLAATYATPPYVELKLTPATLSTDEQPAKETPGRCIARCAPIKTDRCDIRLPEFIEIL